MKTPLDIEQFIRNGRIENELELERALIADRKLKLLSKEDPHFKTVRKKLRDLIEAYEKTNWSSGGPISEEQLLESDLAELIAENERIFISQRKNLIKTRLKIFSLNQQELGLILGHKSKTHMSELMNGIRPFSLKDLVLINRLLKIDMNDLVPVFLSGSEQTRVNTVIADLNKPQLKLEKKDLVA